MQVTLQEFADSIQKDMRDLHAMVADTGIGLTLVCRALGDVDQEVAERLALAIEATEGSDRFPMMQMILALRHTPQDQNEPTAAPFPVHLRLVSPEET